MRISSLRFSVANRSSWRVLGCRLFVLFLLTVSFVSCKRINSENQNTAYDPILVGVFESLTGPHALLGQDSLRGIQLATDEINTKGGVLGRPVKLIVKDNQSKAGKTSVIVRDLINRHHVVALLGEVASGRSLEGAPVAQRSRIPMISSGSTNVRVTQIGNFIFRTCFIDELQGRVIAKFMRSLGIQRAAILANTSMDYSIGLAKSFSQDFIADGGQIVARQEFSERDKDFSPQLTAIKAAHPEAIFLPTYYIEAPSLISQARQLGINVPFFGGDGWDFAEFLQIGGPAVEGAYFSTHFSPNDQAPLVQNFVKNYTQKYRMSPSALSALAYDSAKLLADAIQRANSTDPTKIRDALKNTKNFPAVAGNITFDKDRNPQKPAVIIKIKNGKFAYLKTIAL